MIMLGSCANKKNAYPQTWVVNNRLLLGEALYVSLHNHIIVYVSYAFCLYVRTAIEVNLFTQYDILPQ